MEEGIDELGSVAGGVFAQELFHIGGNAVSLGMIVWALVFFIVAMGLSWLARRAADKAFALRGVSNPSTLAMTNRLIHYAFVFVGLGVALETVGFELSALFAAGAVFAVGLGFAMQNIMENFVSGLIVMVEQTIKPYDVIELNGKIVRVQRMHMRSTLVRTTDEEVIVVPNSHLVQNLVMNLTLKEPMHRIRATVGVSYSSDMAQVRRVLEQTAAAVAPLADPKPVVMMVGFGASSVDWEVSIWTDDPWRTPAQRGVLFEAIWFALKEAAIEIPFPQLDLHVKQGPSRQGP